LDQHAYADAVVAAGSNSSRDFEFVLFEAQAARIVGAEHSVVEESH
jgi:hypothetical protein